jgi:2-dehydropantoate 2-reductase
VSGTVRILIVGTGALGQVLGCHLARGGAEVHALVRPARAAIVQRGFRLWRIRRGRAPMPLELSPATVITSPEQAAADDWDAVLLCVPSDALDGDWASRLAAATAPAAFLAVGQAAGDVRKLEQIAGDRAVTITPALFAWHVPLKDEVPQPGTGDWIPPGAKQLVGGDKECTAPLVSALRAGGLRAAYSPDAATEGARMAARTIPIIAALEATRWSLRALRSDPLLAVATRAAAEADAAVAARAGAKAKPEATTRRLGLVLRLLPALVPFDVEAYAHQQFSKVAGQTRLMFEEWIGLAEEQQLEAVALSQLQRAWRGAP